VADWLEALWVGVGGLGWAGFLVFLAGLVAGVGLYAILRECDC
jgi:hypothetical protein